MIFVIFMDGSFSGGIFLHSILLAHLNDERKHVLAPRSFASVRGRTSLDVSFVHGLRSQRPSEVSPHHQETFLAYPFRSADDDQSHITTEI